MEILANTEYQDVYRIKDGVLLIINKFKPIKIEGIDHPYITINLNRYNSKIYYKGCQKILKILTKEYRHEKTFYDSEWCIPIGTVVYGSIPVEIASKNEWQYQIKTTGELFSGTLNEIIKYINAILQIIS